MALLQRTGRPKTDAFTIEVRGAKPSVAGDWYHLMLRAPWWVALLAISGAFEGETLGHVVEITTEDADSDYGYGDGERNGKDYVAWLSSGRNKNISTRTAALLVAEHLGIEPLESNQG